MSVSYVSIGTGVDSSTTTLSLGTPGGVAPTAGDMIIAIIGFWNANRTPPALNSAAVTHGWATCGDSTGTDGGGGTYGLDTGPRDVAAYWVVSDGTETSVGFDLDDTDAGAGVRGYTMTFSQTDESWATPIGVAGADNTNGTPFSCTGASDFGGAGSVNGDMLAVSAVNRPDTATQGSPAVTYATGTYTQRGSGAGGAGHDGRVTLGSFPVTGTSSGAPVFTATLSASGTGVAIFVRLRSQSTATPGAITVSGALPAATLGAGSTASPAATAIPVALPAASAGAGATAAPSVLAVTISVPEATASGGGSATATPSAIALTIAYPSPTLSAGSTTAPAVIPVTLAMPTVTTGAGASASPEVLPVTISLPAAAASGTTAGTATPGVITCVATLPAPTSTGGGTATPDTVPLTLTIPAATVRAHGAASPTAIPVTLSTPAPVLSTGSTATPGTVAVVTAVPNPGIAYGTAVNPATVALAITLAAAAASGTPPDVNPITVTVRDTHHTVTVTGLRTTATARTTGNTVTAREQH